MIAAAAQAGIAEGVVVPAAVGGAATRCLGEAPERGLGGGRRARKNARRSRGKWGRRRGCPALGGRPDPSRRSRLLIKILLKTGEGFFDFFGPAAEVSDGIREGVVVF